MDVARSELIELLHRRRRLRLMGLVVGTALICGLAVAIATPEVLSGGTDEIAGTELAAATPEEADMVLAEKLALDTMQKRQNLRKWGRLDPDQRREFLHRYYELKDLDPEKRERLIRRFNELQQLSPEQRRFAREKARELRQMISELNPQDLAKLERLRGKERAEWLLRLWKARNKWK